jgi:hypothetical protein
MMIEIVRLDSRDASETGDVRANAVKDELPPFPVVDTSAKPKLPYGTEEYRRRYGNMSVKSKGVSLKWFDGYGTKNAQRHRQLSCHGMKNP